MKRTLIMNLLSSEKRVAVLENNKAVEFYFSHPSSVDLNGNIYMGRVTKVLPGMQAAFVDIGLEKNGFLHRDQLHSFQSYPLSIEERKKKNISEFVREGELLLVQVEKNSVGTKGTKLTNMIEFPGQYVVYVPNGDYIAVSKKMGSEAIRSLWKSEMQSLLSDHEGVIVRTAAQEQIPLIVTQELNRLRNEYKEIRNIMIETKRPTLLKSFDRMSDKLIQDIGISTIDEIVVDELDAYKRLRDMYPQVKFSYHLKRENIFSHYEIEQEIEKLNKKTVWLPNGSYLVFEHTEAMTIIDVNTGKFTGKTNLKDTVWKTNEQAALEVARQIRFRDIGGMILVDFIDMKSVDERNRIIELMKQQVTQDRTRTIVYGFTQLGILEITRKRVRETLFLQRMEACHTCGNGFVPSKYSLAYKLERELLELRGYDAEAIWVEATKDILDIFTNQNTQLQETVENNLHMNLFFTERVDSKPTYVLRHIGSVKEIEDRLNIG
ncbi:Rne/Rng family ribonuclease [Bacillus sp. DJP31]|uniref:Rne/Rng family ribonuclease n=1 Tax=Bacillus sp. DJP31 TaxID=3409789 RepID=UPI003BB6B3F4